MKKSYKNEFMQLFSANYRFKKIKKKNILPMKTELKCCL